MSCCSEKPDIGERLQTETHTDLLCYCFGFSESQMRDEVNSTGTTSIPARISSLIRQGLCNCEALNPKGVCCLGEVIKAAKRLSPRE